MRSRKIREWIGIVVAVAMIVLFAAVGATVAGWNIPVLSDITKALGIAKE